MFLSYDDVGNKSANNNKEKLLLPLIFQMIGFEFQDLYSRFSLGISGFFDLSKIGLLRFYWNQLFFFYVLLILVILGEQ